jgi:septum formation protein
VAELILASASPRRRDLLRARGVSFRVVVADVDESFAFTEDADSVAHALATRKAQAVAERLTAAERADAFVLAGDTLVVVPTNTGLRYLEKAADVAEARDMLRALSDTTHRVVTGVAVWHAGHVRAAAETTFVTMRALTAAEIDAYVASGEWRDKAGGYAIQGEADRFVTQLAGGGFDNVVGLPVDLTLRLLSQAGWLDPDQVER